MAAGDKTYRLEKHGLSMEYVSQGFVTLEGRSLEVWRPAVESGGSTANSEPAVVAGRTVTVGVNLTRPADVLAYAALDVVSNSVSSGTVLTFPNLARKIGGSGYITKARISTNQGANLAVFRLHLFAVSPDAGTNLNDNVAYTQLFANKDKAIGTIDFPAMATEGGGSDSARAMNSDIRLAFANSSSANIIGILETLSAFTPVSGQQFYIELTAEQN